MASGLLRTPNQLMSCVNSVSTHIAHGSACTATAGQLLIPDLYDRIGNRRLNCEVVGWSLSIGPGEVKEWGSRQT